MTRVRGKVARGVLDAGLVGVLAGLLAMALELSGLWRPFEPGGDPRSGVVGGVGVVGADGGCAPCETARAEREGGG